MRVITSFSGRLHYACGMEALHSMVEQLGGEEPVLAYHEESVENRFPLRARHICECDKLTGVSYIDVFNVDPELDNIIHYPEFDQHGKVYMKQNAPYWFRKIAAIRHAVTHNPPDYYLWLDCDCFVKQPFLPAMWQYFQEHDICYIDRVKMPTDTGVIMFNTHNPKVIQFIEEWYDLYRAKRVFSFPDWADTYAFDQIRAQNRYLNLSFGPLQSGHGQTLWFNPGTRPSKKREWEPEKDWRYIHHLKRPLKQIRVGSKKKSAYGNCGHLYLAFGEEYDKVAAYSAIAARQHSELPIHVLSNLPPGKRNGKWQNVSNVTFRYFPMRIEENRQIKTALVYYSPFDMTLYTDADSVILSPDFMQEFARLKVADVLLPVYADNVVAATLPKHQKVAFQRALVNYKSERWGGSEPFTIYGGGVCFFTKRDGAFKFFGRWNNLYDKLPLVRDMPSLAIAVAELDDVSVEHLSNEYNRVESCIIQSVHGNARSPYLPEYTPYRPDDRTNKWTYQPKKSRSTRR